MSSDQDDTKSYEKLGYLIGAITRSCGRSYFQKILNLSGDINYRVPDDDFFRFRKSYCIGNTALHLVSDENSIAIEILLENGADFTLKNNEGLTALHRVIHGVYRNFLRKHQIEEFYDWLKNDIRVKNILTAHIKTANYSNPCDDNGISHFHIACLTNHVEAVDFFLLNGVPVNHVVSKNSPIFSGYTPLHMAAQCQSLETVELLLKYGAKIDAKDNKGKTPMQVLIERDMEVVDWMHSRNSRCYYFKHLDSCRDAKEKIANMMVERTSISELQFVDEVGLSLLHVACTMEDATMAESYLRSSVYIDRFVRMDSFVWPGYTALHFAAHFNSETAKLLVSKGANIEAKDAYGVAPLDIFAERFNVEDVHFILLFHSVWKNIELSDGKTKLLDLVFAMQTANQLGKFLDDRKLAIDVFIPYDSPLWPGYTILHLAVMFTETIKIASKSSKYNKDSDVDATNEESDDTYISWRYDFLQHRLPIKRKRSSQEYFQRLKLCLNRGANITTQDLRGWTPLIYAFRLKQIDTISLLLSFDSKGMNPTDEDNLSHLYIACYVKNQSVVEKLLANGAEVNIHILPTFKWHKNEHSFIHRFRSHSLIGSTPLHISVSYADSAEITSILLKYGADVNAKDGRGLTSVHELLFTFGDQNEIAYVLLSAKSLKPSSIDGGLNHLHVASYFGNVGAAKRLIDLGADINATILTNSLQILFSGINVYSTKPLKFITKYAGYTPLQLAICKNNQAVIELLLRRAADIFVKDSTGWSPICISLEPRYVSEVNELVLSALERDVLLQKRLIADSGITMLHIACWKVDVEAVKLLLNEGADVNAQAHSDLPICQKYTPLHFLMTQSADRDNARDRIEAILLLLAGNGADLTLTNSESSTPLHLTEAKDELLFQFKDSYFKYVDSPYVSLLLEFTKHLKINPTNVDGISHFHISCLRNDLEIIEHFLQNGVDVDQRINLLSKKYPGCTPLHLALYYKRAISNSSRFATVKLLLRYGANVGAKNKYYNTPLHYISNYSPPRENLLKVVVDAGADINARNMNEETPFELLLKSNTATIAEVDFFLERGCFLNAFNPVTKEGYMTQIFIVGYSTKKSLLPLIQKVMCDCNPLKTDELGRSVIHNIVSTSKSWIFSYTDLIQHLTSQGCDIDHQDSLGRTALHTAVQNQFRNCEAIRGLLENGADINITDNSGKTAFVRSFEFFNQYEYDETSLIYRCQYLMNCMATHVRKLQISGLYVHESNNRVLENLPPECAVQDNKMEIFIMEMEQAKSVSIVSSITLFHFLSETGSVAAYPNMLYTDREAVDKFFKSINENQLCKEFMELKSLLNLQYRKVLQRQYLLEDGLAALNDLLTFPLPELCALAILRFLSNADLKSLIFASSNF